MKKKVKGQVQLEGPKEKAVKNADIKKVACISSKLQGKDLFRIKQSYLLISVVILLSSSILL